MGEQDSEGDTQTCWVFGCDSRADTEIISNRFVGNSDPRPTCQDCAEEFVHEGRGWEYAE